MIDPWKLEEEMLLAGLDGRAAAAVVHEALDAQTWIEVRAAGFRERASGDMIGVQRMLFER